MGSDFRWYKDSGVRLALIGSGLIALIYNFVDELSPIFISAPFDRVINLGHSFLYKKIW